MARTFIQILEAETYVNELLFRADLLAISQVMQVVLQIWRIWEHEQTRNYSQYGAMLVKIGWKNNSRSN